MVASTPQSQDAVRETVARLLDEHRALRQRLEQLEAEIAQIPVLLDTSNHDRRAGRNPSIESPLGDDPEDLRGRARHIGDIVSPVDMEWDAEQ